MKKLFFVLSLLLTASGAFAQYPLVTISDIQTVSGANLSNCRDTSSYYGDTVRVRGVVLMNGGLAQAAGGRNVWIQSGPGNFSGLDVFGFSATATSPDDILNLVAGDSVEITGYVDEYQGESEIRPLQSGTSLQILGSKPVPAATVVNLSDLNDNGQNNLLSTGEKYEGMFIELQNVTVSAVTYFSGNTRVSFVVQDAGGNKINVSDRFMVGRLPAMGGTFVPPTVGDQYCYLRGVLMHSKNNCAGFNGRGYELHPFDASNYSVCSAAPSIFNVTRNYVTPTSAQSVTVTAQITDADGVQSATLNYAVGISNNTYTPVAMTFVSGNTWTGTIPAQSNAAFVKYYVCATDSQSNTGCNTNVPGGSNPYFYTVRDNGTTIYDVQFVPASFGTGASGYVDMDVTVTGVVTASAQANNLGYVFIQEEGRLDWGGIMVTGSGTLANVTVGQKITVTGTVTENFGFTIIGNVTSVVTAGSGTITPLRLQPSTFSTYSFATNEAYEGMLVELYNPSGRVYVVNQNADGPASNFAEYRVGTDTLDPANGCRIRAGRQTSSAFSSLNVSYVNDSMWATTDGIMNVPVCVVHYGSSFDSIVGVVEYSFSNMKILPRNNSDYFGDQSGCLSVGNEKEVSRGIVLYPNPAAGRVSIQYDLPAEAAGSLLEIHDISGRRMLQARLDGQTGIRQIETADLPNGSYLVSVRGDNGYQSFSKLVIVR